MNWIAWEIQLSLFIVRMRWRPLLKMTMMEREHVHALGPQADVALRRLEAGSYLVRVRARQRVVPGINRLIVRLLTPLRPGRTVLRIGGAA